MQKSVLKIILVLYIISINICYVKTDVIEDENIDSQGNNLTEYDLKDPIDDLNEFNDVNQSGNGLIDENGNEELIITIDYPSEPVTKDRVTKPIRTIDIDSQLTNNYGHEKELTTTSIKQTKTTIKEPKITNSLNNNNNKQATQQSYKVITLENNEKTNDEKNKIAPINSFSANENTNNYNNNSEEFNVDNSNNNDINEDEEQGLFGNSNINNKTPGGKFTENIGTIVIFVGAVSVGLVAVSGYQVYKRKNEKGLKTQEYFSSSLTQSSSVIYENENIPKITLDTSLIIDNETQNQAYEMYYSAKNLEKEKEEPQKQDVLEMDTLPYQSSKPRPRPASIETSITTNTLSLDRSLGRNSLERNSLGRTLERNSLGRNSIRSTISRNSIVRHSFLNPNILIVRTGKRTQQLFEATNEHPAIIETFPSMERPFEPAVPVPLEESDINSLHPYSYQMYQEEMEVDKYYAYTIEDKEYIIDPSTNRVLEIHDLTTDEYSLVEEELYLDFSGSEDSDSDKQSL